MRKRYILPLLTSFFLSFVTLLLLPILSRGVNFQVKALPLCEMEGGTCYPRNYNCTGGAASNFFCDSGLKCYIGGTCTAPTGPTAGCGAGSINTAFGCIRVADQRGFTIQLMRVGVGIGGGIAFILMVYAGFIIMTSSGDPRRLTAGKELLTAAISGLLLVIGGAYVLRLIGVDLLGIF